jgi:RecJ-like exonuclease
MSNTAVPCNNCSGKGYIINQFNQHENECRTCEGTGNVIPCDNFSSSKSSAWRNRQCDGCHATENQHKISVSA